MASKTAQIIIQRGVTFTRIIRFRDPVTLLLIDLTGKILSFHIRKSQESVDFFNLVVGASPTTLGSSLVMIDTEQARLTITDEETATWTDFEQGHWHQKLSYSGEVHEKGSGRVLVQLP